MTWRSPAFAADPGNQTGAGTGFTPAGKRSAREKRLTLNLLSVMVKKGARAEGGEEKA